MGISLNPQLEALSADRVALCEIGRSDLMKETGLEETLTAEQGASQDEAAKADELAEDLEKLGPTFVKLGQLLSTRVERMARPYLDASCF
jgi:ubiquinone biosynthesis protein